MEQFIGLLQKNSILRVADVRSSPYSRYVPHFSAAPLRVALEEAGIAYVSLPELGGKPSDPALRHTDGSPDYDRMQEAESFRQGIDRLLDIGVETPTAMLCAEADPMACHRERLIAPVLRKRGITVLHILPDGALASPPVQKTLEL